MTLNTMLSFVILLIARTAIIACADRQTNRHTHETTTVTLTAHARRGLISARKQLECNDKSPSKENLVFKLNKIIAEVFTSSNKNRTTLLYTYTAFTLQKPRMVTVLQPFQPRLHHSLKTQISSKPRMRRKNRHQNRHVHAVHPRIHVRTCAQRSIITNN